MRFSRRWIRVLIPCIVLLGLFFTAQQAVALNGWPIIGSINASVDGCEVSFVTDGIDGYDFFVTLWYVGGSEPLKFNRSEHGVFRADPGHYEVRLYVFTPPGPGFPGGPKLMDYETVRVVEDCPDKDLFPSMPPTWYFSVEALPDGPLSNLPDAAGETPCGLFDVLSHGQKALDLSVFENCSSPVTLACVQGDEDTGPFWTSTDISDLMQDGNSVMFMSTQHGTCGIFD